MSRLVRTAMIAALVGALSFTLPAAALAPSSVNLTPARFFDAGSGMLFTLAPRATQTVRLTAALFDVPVPVEIAMAATAAPAQVSQVNLTLQRAQPVLRVAPQAAAPAAPLYADDTQLIAPSIDLAPAPAVHALADSLESPAVRFGAYRPYVPSLQEVAANLVVPLRLGGVHFTAEVSGDMQALHPNAFRALQVCGTTDQAVPCPYLSDTRAQSVMASTNFNLRAGNEPLALQLTGGVERLSVAQNTAFPYVPVEPDPVFGGGHVSAFDPQEPLLRYPGVTQMIAHSMGARLAVPVTPRVTVGLQYQQQHYQGTYGDLLFPGVNARKDTYLGNVTYQLPFLRSSAITLSARQYRYQDALSADSLTQTRADLNFTVKF